MWHGEGAKYIRETHWNVEGNAQETRFRAGWLSES